MKQFIGHWGISPALQGRTSIVDATAFTPANGYSADAIEDIMALNVFGVWVNPACPGHTIQRIDDSETSELDAETEQIYIVEVEVDGFALVTARISDAASGLETASFSVKVYGRNPNAPVFSQETIGRAGLNLIYRDAVGYRPDDDAGKAIPILELISNVGGAMLFEHIFML